MEALTCDHCGAPLRVPPSVKYVTCAHCGARLAITRTDDTAFTEAIEKLRARTEHLSEEMD